MDLSSLKAFCNPYYADKDIMHNLSHIERVLRLALDMVDKGNYDAKRHILIYAAYFHGFIYDYESEIIFWLRKQDLPQDEIDHVVKAAGNRRKVVSPKP
ncbi:hypothetical protein HNQ80_001618 [Anaerosolibacter carboniphilus]|uniref:Uncharacterized protein n=1 Tax=Anaerosolibacter carboniphilus TaxID=1417629 RepID=A0A841KZG1_9FIRM|nr:hypothetical protein [Anaerosolibacter carboniphilus]MBB6215529.1 hypothetical protein [Anaerosolibacter carboniphilus]